MRRNQKKNKVPIKTKNKVTLKCVIMGCLQADNHLKSSLNLRIKFHIEIHQASKEASFQKINLRGCNPI